MYLGKIYYKKRWEELHVMFHSQRRYVSLSASRPLQHIFSTSMIAFRCLGAAFSGIAMLISHAGDKKIVRNLLQCILDPLMKTLWISICTSFNLIFRCRSAVQVVYYTSAPYSQRSCLSSSESLESGWRSRKSQPRTSRPGTLWMVWNDLSVST